MVEKVIEMPLNTAGDVMKFILAHAGGAIGSRHLVKDERTIIEHGVRQLKTGLGMLHAGDAVDREECARLLMLGAFKVGSHAVVSASVINFRNAEKHGPSGKKTGEAKREQAEKWRGFVRRWIAGRKSTGSKMNASGMTKELLKAVPKPGSITLPEFETLIKFVRKELKAPDIARGKARNLRIVHG